MAREQPAAPGESPGIIDVFDAARDGDVERLVEILRGQPALADAGAPGPCENYRVEKPIHVAAREGHEGAVEALMDAGASAIAEFQPFMHSHCALTIARERRHTRVVEAIYWRLRRRFDEEPASIHRTDGHGNTVLHLAVYHRDHHLVRELIARGVEVDRPNRWGQRPVHLALYYDWTATAADRALAEMLLVAGAAADIWICSALGDVDGVRRLLDGDRTLARVPVGAGPVPGGARFALGIAALEGHLDVVRLLLDAGADPDARNTYSFGEVSGHDEAGVPLVFAMARGHLEIVHLLLDRGARADAPPMESGPSPMDQALETGDRALIDRMVIGGGRPGLHSYVQNHDYLLIGELLDRCPEAASDGGGGTLAADLLHLAAWLGEPNVVRMCLRRRPEITTTEGLDLLWATLWSHNLVGDWDDYAAVTRLLLEYGIQPDGGSPAGPSRRHSVPPGSGPLHWVSIARGRLRGRQERMVEYAGLLLDHGAAIDARDGETGATPLAWAARHGHEKLVEFLLERGAALTLPGDDGSSTPLAWARKIGHHRIVEILREAGEAE